ncbi:MAG: LamG domain-containing protein [Myxococcota bacterium]
MCKFLALELILGVAGIGVLLASVVSAETRQLAPISASQDTANKPQSKVWFYSGAWWAVMPTTAESPQGTWLWRLEESHVWSSVLHLSSSTDVRADVTLDGSLAHIFLHGSSPELVSIEFDSGSAAYVPWSVRPANTALPLPGSETGSVVVDSTGRLWIATESGAFVHAYYADPPYVVFNGPIQIASGIASDDISAIAALPSSAIGILWSNQNSERFGFRVHFDSDSPSTWQPDEIPASQSARNVGGGMADDHLNLAVGADGTLYAAVKTSYDTVGYPKIALLIRRPNGVWDDLYGVDEIGTRPFIVLNETIDRLHVVYTANDRPSDIVFKETAATTIDFGPLSTLMSGRWNNSTSTPKTWSGEIAVLASNGSSASGVLTDFPLCDAEPPRLRGHWRADVIQGGTLRDSSRYGNHGTIEGEPVEVPGYRGGAISVEGDDYVVVSANCSLEVQSTLTVAAWIRPTRVGTQRVIRKVNGENGFSLFLSANGNVSIRLNDTNGLRVNSRQEYPTDGTEWMHIAATYDGNDIKLYVNGVLDGQASASTVLDGKDAPLSIGATSTGADAFQGALDDVRLYNYALTEPEIQRLVSQPLLAMPWPAQIACAVVLVTAGVGMRRRFRGSGRNRETRLRSLQGTGPPRAPRRHQPSRPRGLWLPKAGNRVRGKNRAL